MNEEFAVVLSRLAREDIINGIRWYENRKTGLGREFEEELNQRILEVANSPFICQKIYKQARAAHLRRFPYSIQYVVDEQARRVNIFRIRPQAGDPAEWKGSYPEKE